MHTTLVFKATRRIGGGRCIDNMNDCYDPQFEARSFGPHCSAAPAVCRSNSLKWMRADTLCACTVVEDRTNGLIRVIHPAAQAVRYVAAQNPHAYATAEICGGLCEHSGRIVPCR